MTPSDHLDTIRLGGSALTLTDVRRVARGARVEVSPQAWERVEKAAAYVEAAGRSGKNLYGITTGFGACADVSIAPADAHTLQHNLIVSHACGLGEPLPTAVVRTAMALRINTLLQGHSGITAKTLRLLIELLNRRMHPQIPEQGSVGASGDLAPLSHMALPLLGLGEVEVGGDVLPGAVALERAGLKPIELTFKEGLALTNGTQITTALALVALFRVRRLQRVADIAAAMSLEALCGRSAAFDERIHALRAHPGQRKVARHIRALTRGSQLVGRAPETVPGKRALPQDSYSLRCVPQVHGATEDALAYIESVLARESGSVTDNPILFPDDDDVISGGNFHAQPVAMAADHLKIATANLGNISERRVAKLVDRTQNEGLPPFLIDSAGLNSGLMIPQYVAASLASENKTLAHPASVDTIPTSANTEDHVSMGPIAGRHAVLIATHVARILSIELVTACQAIDCRLRQLGLGTDALGEGTAMAYEIIRQRVTFAEADRPFGLDLVAAQPLVQTDALVEPLSPYFSD